MLEGNRVKFWLLVFLLVSPALVKAQAAADRAAPACGPNDTKFVVKTGKTKDSAITPSPGKALIYFIEDDTAFESIPRPTVRFGIDGSWVGATHSNSWFALPVDPGEHHLCANWQTRVVLLGSSHQTAAAHFTAKAGRIYFFRMQNTWNRVAGLSVNFARLDVDEGQILMQEFAFSTFRPKK